MRILLYNPDNGVSANFMPHLWMFVLQALTPAGHEVLLIDGNTQPMSDAEIVRFVLAKGIGLVGIGAMTRMIAKAYRVADAIRTAGVPVVMGGPHVTELPEEALGRDGGPRHADAVALGEADETWPKIVADAARSALKERYVPVDAFGQERKPDLQGYPKIPWDSLDIDQFNRIPGFVRRIMEHFRCEWETFHIIPIESGRGCPYGCEFCTVTGFFGDSIRFRSNQSIVEELLLLKTRARRTRGQVAVFFVDDNFAINGKRTKSLLRDIIAANAQVSWVGQISANLLRDEELVDLIADSGGRWIFIGMESLDPANLASVNKSYLVHLRSGQRQAGSCRAHAEPDSRMAASAAGLRTDHTFSGHTALHTSGERGPADAAEALAGFCAVPHGAHAFAHDRVRGAGGSALCLDERLQPHRHAQSHRFDRERAGAVQDQPFDRTAFLPWHLLSEQGRMGVAESDRGQPRDRCPRRQGVLHQLARE
jgi:hypothetical protein